MNSIKIALAQSKAVLGDIDANLDSHLATTQEARKDDVDLVIFPELSMTGYVLQDLTPQVALDPSDGNPYFKNMLDASKGIDIVFGFVEAGRRHRFFISAAYLSQGEIIHIHRKVYLPTYGLFDEGRFFAKGDRVRAFDTRFGRLGMLICEDFWHASPPYLLWLDGAEVLMLISASPGRGLQEKDKLESAAWVERINQAYASLFTTYVVHTNRVGFEDGLHFWGGATVYDPNGELVVRGPYHEESLVMSTIDLGQIRRTRSRLPLLRDERVGLMQREMNRLYNDLSSGDSGVGPD